MAMSTHKTSELHHQVAMEDMLLLLNAYAGRVSGLELLAIAANLTGKIAAMQDAATVTSEDVIEIIRKNLEIGNQEAILHMHTKGNA